MLSREDIETMNEIKKSKCLSGKSIDWLASKFGERFWKALRATSEGGVKKYIFEPSEREVWIVVGKARDYFIVSDLYCSCEDFYMSVVVRKRSPLCYHILSKMFAEMLGLFSTYKVHDDRYNELIKEWRNTEATPRRGRKK
ncbi:MAG: hypothetical protein ACFFA1_05255 [Promethearchaeota archaeon]